MTELTLSGEITALEFWQPTCNLRWKEVEIEVGNGTGITIKQLQQLWISNLGNEEWRVIPIEE